MEYRPGEAKPRSCGPPTERSPEADSEPHLDGPMPRRPCLLRPDARRAGLSRCGDGPELWQTDGITEPKSGASIHLTPATDGAVYLFTDEGVLIRAVLSPSGYEERPAPKSSSPPRPSARKNAHGRRRPMRTATAISATIWRWCASTCERRRDRERDRIPPSARSNVFRRFRRKTRTFAAQPRLERETTGNERMRPRVGGGHRTKLRFQFATRRFTSTSKAL